MHLLLLTLLRKIIEVAIRLASIRVSKVCKPSSGMAVQMPEGGALLRGRTGALAPQSCVLTLMTGSRCGING